MNHRRQENTLQAYSAFLDSLNKADSNHDTVLSICEWGKTQPHNWGYKVGNSWRILNDITFSVGNTNGGYGNASWSASGTNSITSQYSKAVIMDEYSGLDKGWNDPDMMVIGMNGITNVMSKSHMTMWCMMNSPIMLGFDLRRVTKGDDTWKIIANKDVLALNQDPLGVQAKRIYCSVQSTNPDKTYVTNTNRVDILAKPLENGDVALSFLNLNSSKNTSTYSVDINSIISYIGSKMVNASQFQNAGKYYVKDVWTKEASLNNTGVFSVSNLEAYDNVTIRITPLSDSTYPKTLLGDQISGAEGLLAAKTPPAYPSPINEANSALQSEIDKAKGIYNNSEATIDQLVNAYVELKGQVDTFNNAYALKDNLKVQIDLSKAELAEKQQTGLPAVLQNANTAFGEEIIRIEAIYNSAGLTVADIQTAYNDIVQQRASFKNIYDSFDNLETAISEAQAIQEKAEKYHQDANWTAFISKLNQALNACISAVTIDEVVTATSELNAAKSNISKIVPPTPNGGGNITWYKFDEESGAAAIDSSGWENDAAIIGATGNRVDGRLGKALQLQSANSQYVQLPQGIASELGDFTIATWINPATMDTWARVFDFGNDTNTYMFLTLRTGTNNLPRFAIKVNGGSEQTLTAGSGFTLSANTWYHIAVTKSGNTANMYLNGSLAATNTGMTLKPSDMGVTANNWIGRSQWPDPYLNGMVDEFSIYGRALSADDIKALTITSAPAIDVITSAGVAPVLPGTVTVNYHNGTSGTAAVTWAAIDPASYASAGTFAVNGTIAGSSLTVTANVTVPAVTVPVTGVTLDKNTVSLAEGSAVTLTATVAPANATNKSVIWSSSNTGAATVDSTGKVTAVAVGTAIITATTVDGGKTAACNVTVTPSVLGYYADNDGKDTPLISTVKVNYGTSETEAKAGLSTSGYAKLSDGSYVPVTIAWTFDTAYVGTAPGVKAVTGAVAGAFPGGLVPVNRTGTVTVLPDSSGISTYLSDLTFTSSTNGWGPVEKDMSVGEQASGDGNVITLNGVQYNKGLGTNSASEIVYDIGGNYDTFVSDVGIDDDVGDRGSVTFEVWGDGTKLWDSGLMLGTTPARSAIVDIKGVKTLKLVVTIGGDDNAYDHADWAGAKLVASPLSSAVAISADSSVQPGSSFTVGIGLNNLVQSVYAEDITLTYDSNVFEYVSAAGINSNIQIAKEDKATSGKVRLMAANIGGVTGNSTQVLNVAFKVKAGIQNTAGSIAVTQAKLGVAPQGTVIEAALDSKSISIGSSGPVVDKTALTTAIDNAQSLYDAAVVGTQPGQYPQAAKDALNTAINTAKAVKNDPGATQSQVDSALTALNTAVNAFKAAVNKSADINKDGSIDVGDLAIVAYYYGKDSTAADWDTAKVADAISDNRIDISDLAYVASKILE